MAVPRRRTSKSKKRKRRTHHSLSAPTTSLCSQCRQPKESHSICQHCGYYKGRLVVEVEELS